MRNLTETVHVVGYLSREWEYGVTELTVSDCLLRLEQLTIKTHFKHPVPHYAFQSKVITPFSAFQDWLLNST